MIFIISFFSAVWELAISKFYLEVNTEILTKQNDPYFFFI